jgi:hypothetical protein
MAITRCYLRGIVLSVYSSSFLATIVKPDGQGESSNWTDMSRGNSSFHQTKEPELNHLSGSYKLDYLFGIRSDIEGEERDEFLEISP